MVKFKDLGPVSAYALAKAHGYTGTEDQWAREQAAAGQNARIALESKNDAVAARDAATEQAANALKSAQSASQAEKSAIQEATVASNSAKEAMAHSTNAKTEAKNASTSATNAATNATEARNEADRAKTEADRAVSTVRKTLEDAKTSGEFDGPKGETGDSGVVISDTEPIDPNVSVWFRRSGTPVKARNIIADIPPELPSNTEKTVQAVLQALASRKSSDGNKVAPAIPETLTGPVVATDIVSTLDHEVECAIHRKNELKYPYENGTKIVNGITYTVNTDGSVTADGTASARADFEFWYKSPLKLKAGWEYTVKLTNSTDGDTKLQISNAGTYVTVMPDDPVTFTCKNGEIGIYLITNGTVTNNMSKVVITEGKKAAEFTPYVPDLSKVTVSRYGKSIAPADVLQMDTWEVIDNQLYKDFILPPDMKEIYFRAEAKQNEYVSVAGKDPGDSKYTAIKGVRLLNNERESTTKKLVITPGRLYKLATTLNAELVNMQESVTNFAEFAAPAEPIIYHPSPDGTVTGMTSLSPSMTILTDNPGVTVEATYNADTKGFIKREIANQNAAQTAAYERGVSNA